MHKGIFVNLPVSDLKRSVDFFTKLGYTFNPQFTDENATCMIIGENIFVMLLVEPFFTSFIPNSVADSSKVSEVIVALACSSREEVTALTTRAFDVGAKKYKDPEDHGFMFGWGFQDLDGHFWEPFWMDPAHVQ